MAVPIAAPRCSRRRRCPAGTDRGRQRRRHPDCAPFCRQRLTRWVGVIVTGAFPLITSPIASYKQRDRILAAEAATFLLSQLVAWLFISFIGYTLLAWPFTSGGIASAVSLAGPAVLGPNDALGAAERIIADLAAGTALIIVTLQIAYLPTLYSAFNRREDDVSLLNARAGSRPGGRSCWPVPTTLWARAPRRSTRCPTCTSTGRAGRPTWPRAIPPTCRWCGFAPPGRCHPG